MSAFSATSETSTVDICLLTIKECFVYKVPPLRTASGHRAEDWNLAVPLFTGCLKLFQAGDTLKLIIYSFKDPKNTAITPENIQTFGECPIQVKPGENILQFVDAVIDSSRYYVVRIKDPKSARTTLIGVGFREREDAFDLKNSLNDYVKFINRMNLASQLASNPLDNTFGDLLNLSEQPDNLLGDDADGPECAVTGSGYQLSNTKGPAESGAHSSYSHIPALKEGEKIKISIGGKSKHTGSGEKAHAATTGVTTGAGAGKGGFGLKPPPPPGSVVHFQGGAPASAAEASAPVASSAGSAAADEDWGDFN